MSNNGNDNLIGHGGPDTLVGGAGIDTLTGGPGVDILMGGSEAENPPNSDLFILDDFGPGLPPDRIFDFNRAQGDEIRVRLGGVDQAFATLVPPVNDANGNALIFSAGGNLVGILYGVDATTLVAADFDPPF